MEWCIEQIGMLAVKLGEQVTPERLQLYADDLTSDLSTDQIRTAIYRAGRELRFFPKPAELRELSGAPKPAQREEVETKAAFALVVRHLEREGVMEGMKSLPPRVQYAVRACGGLFTFNRRLQVHYGDDENPSQVQDFSHFLVADFAEAYKNFPTHLEMQPELTAKGLTALPQPVRLFLKPEFMKPETRMIPTLEPLSTPPEIKAETPILKKMRSEPTDAELRDRKEILRQQAEQILSQRKSAQAAQTGGWRER